MAHKVSRNALLALYWPYITITYSLCRLAGSTLQRDALT